VFPAPTTNDQYLQISLSRINLHGIAVLNPPFSGFFNASFWKDGTGNNGEGYQEEQPILASENTCCFFFLCFPLFFFTPFSFTLCDMAL
jgi:hypothetical protein